MRNTNTTKADQISKATASAAAAVQAAVDNHTAAIAKAHQTAMDADAAARQVAGLDQRLKTGDATVDIETMIESKASAERLALLAVAYNDALPGFESRIVEARTALTVAKLQAGAIMSRDQLASYVDTTAERIADQVEALMPELQAEAEARAAINVELSETTANGSSRHRFPHAHHTSPIRMGDGMDPDTYEVDGATYSTGLDVSATLARITKTIEHVLISRESTRREPAIMAARAKRAAADNEGAEIARREREANFRPTGGNALFLGDGRIVIDG